MSSWTAVRRLLKFIQLASRKSYMVTICPNSHAKLTKLEIRSNWLEYCLEFTSEFPQHMNNYFPWAFHDKSFIFHVKIPQLMQSFIMPKSQLYYNAYWNVSSYERIKWHTCQFLYMVMLDGPLTSDSMNQTGIATVYVNKCSNLNKSYTIYHYSLPLMTLLILFLHNRRVVITIRCCIIDSLGKCFKWLLVWKIKWQVYTVRMRGALRCKIIVSFEGNPFKRRWASTWYRP